MNIQATGRGVCSNVAPQQQQQLHHQQKQQHLSVLHRQRHVLLRGQQQVRSAAVCCCTQQQRTPEQQPTLQPATHAIMQQQQQHWQQQQRHPLQLMLPSSQRRLRCSAAAAAWMQTRSRNNSSSSSGSSTIPHPLHHQHLHQRQSITRPTAAAAAAAAAADGSGAEDEQQQQQSPGSGKLIPPRILAAAADDNQETYSLKDTQVLVETAMLSAVSGLAFLLSTLLKLDNSLGYFLPLPITIAACRSGVAAGWHTMMATAFLLLVLLGPLRAITYVLMHGVLAASLGSMWVWKWPWQLSIPAGAVLRMCGQLGYLVLSSLTMNENLFSVMLANVHNLLDQLSAALGSYGSPSTLAITCMIFALLLVNGLCYCFLLHVVYHVILGSMGFKLGTLPRFVSKYLYAGVPQQQQPQK